METVTAELLLGEGAGGVKCIVGRGSGGFGRGLSSLESGGNISIGASWAFDAKKRVCVSRNSTRRCDCLSLCLGSAMGDSKCAPGQ